MDVRRVLLDARRHAGLTQAELAAKAGTSQATVSAYESGRKQPSIDTLERLLAATGRRLTVERGIVREPNGRDHATAGRRLAEVLSLAEALPARRRRDLRFPRLAA